MLEINQLTADWYLKTEYEHKSKLREEATGKKDTRFDYLRVDGKSTSSSASTTKKNLDQLTSEANVMWIDNQE